MQKRYEQNCPVARTLDLIGDRWTLLIIRDIFLGATRFNEFLSNSPGLPPKVLSQRLKYLIETGIVERRLEDGYPPRAEYILSDYGRSLFPVIKAIGQWGADHLYEGEDDLRDEIVASITSRIPEFDE